jgi:hypothetical protein
MKEPCLSQVDCHSNSFKTSVRSLRPNVLGIPVETVLTENFKVLTPSVEKSPATALISIPWFSGDLRELAPD